MILIADSGSTKTAWALTTEAGQILEEFTTSGINPVLLTDGELRESIASALAVLKHKPARIHFYGAGCRPDQKARVASVLTEATGCEIVTVESDLLGACRALCQHEPGICAILGTGSASCYYDGEQIAQQTPSLGYVLGDEGSGTSLGKHLVSDALKGQLPHSICQALEQEEGVTVAYAIERVYRQPWPNRWLASLAPFLKRHANEPSVRAIIVEEFRRFAARNIKPYLYNAGEPALHCVGSIAYYLQDELRESLEAEGMTLGRIVQAPLHGLVAYHTANAEPDVTTPYGMQIRNNK